MAGIEGLISRKRLIHAMGCWIWPSQYLGAFDGGTEFRENRTGLSFVSNAARISHPPPLSSFTFGESLDSLAEKGRK